MRRPLQSPSSRGCISARRGWRRAAAGRTVSRRSTELDVTALTEPFCDFPRFATPGEPPPPQPATVARDRHHMSAASAEGPRREGAIGSSLLKFGCAAAWPAFLTAAIDGSRPLTWVRPRYLAVTTRRACWRTAPGPRGTVGLCGAAMRVLIVEDHQELAQTIALGLRREGMAVDVALDGETGLRPRSRTLRRRRPRSRPALVHGDDVCRALVAAAECAPRLPDLTPLPDNVSSRVDGLSLGAERLPAPAVRLADSSRARAVVRRGLPARRRS